MRQPIAVFTALAVLAAPFAALAAPAATLPTDPTARAASCAAAIAAVNGGLDGQPITFAAADRIGQFALIGSEGDPDRMGPLGEAIAAASKAIDGRETALATVAACDRAYPATVASAPLRMPTDTADRGLACLIIAGTMNGIHNGADPGSAEAQRYQQLSQVLTDKLTPVLTAAGITTEEAAMGRVKVIGKAIGGYGPPYKIADACLKEFG